MIEAVRAEISALKVLGLQRRAKGSIGAGGTFSQLSFRVTIAPWIELWVRFTTCGEVYQDFEGLEPHFGIGVVELFEDVVVLIPRGRPFSEDFESSGKELARCPAPSCPALPGPWGGWGGQEHTHSSNLN